MKEDIGLKVEIETISPTRKRFKIELPREEISSQVEKICAELRKQVIIPGFRKGRAPNWLIIARFEDHIKGELIERLVLPELNRAMEEKGITPLSPVEIKTPLEELKLSGDGPWSIEAEVDVKPEIQLPPYERIKVEKRRPDVPKEEVDKYLEHLRLQHAEYIPIEEDRPVEKGDFVKIDLKLQIPAKELTDIEEKDIILRIGEGAIAPGLDEGMIGMVKGETRRIEADMPRDHPEPDLAGQHVIFEVTLKEILERRLPELNDEFAKDLNFESLEQMRSVIWNRMVEEAKSELREQQRREIVRQLIELTDIPVPESFLEERLQELIQDIRAGRAGTPEDRRKLNDPQRSEEFIEELKRTLADTIREVWIFDEIAKKEGIEVSDEQVENALRLEALRRNIDPQKYVSQMKASGGFDRIKRAIRDSAVLDFIIEKASDKLSVLA